MKRLLFSVLFFTGAVMALAGQDPFPVMGFCIAAPSHEMTDTFVSFISDDLAPRGVNTLVLRVDYNYQYKSHPELADSNGLTEADVKKLVAACRVNGIRIIPQVNLLGHQSWAERTGKLLTVYPQFDETPHIKMPEKYEWPNADSLYCKSYCPLHPDLHRVIFDVIDEICDVFEADAFHAGMDEVFYIASDSCPRCAGKNRAELFAGEVNTIHDHLALKNRELWIWGDRLIDGRATGTGGWEGSRNGTWPAIDMVNKEVVICDWHYEREVKTADLFAEKGFRVISCPWRKADVAIKQARYQRRQRRRADSDIRENYSGMMQTVWTGSTGFLESYYAEIPADKGKNTEASCFTALFKEIDRMK